MALVVVIEQILMEPLIGFYLGLWLVEVVESFMSFFDRPKWSFYFPFRSSRDPPTIAAFGHVSHKFDPQA